MSEHESTTESTIARLEQTLETARFGLDSLRTQTGAGKLAGLRNLIVFGRAVTNVLQTLRGTEPAFDEWYKPRRDEMASDPLLKYFYTLRSQVLNLHYS